MWEYTDKVMDYFLNPKNVGEIENPDGVGEEGSLACGDALKLTFKLGDDGRIADVKFKTFGCASAIASASVMTEMIKGMSLDEAEKVTNKQIADALGGLPEQKMHCSVMGMEALQAAIANYRGGKTKIEKPAVDGKVVCTCFGVTDKEIEKVVLENSLDSVEQVTNYCKAGGGCGGCKAEIKKIIDKVRDAKVEVEKAEIKKPQHMTNIQKIQLIQRTINEQVRPQLKADGGDIELVDVNGNDVLVVFRGMCASCRAAELTLKEVVEAKLKEFVCEDIIVSEENSHVDTHHVHKNLGGSAQ